MFKYFSLLFVVLLTTNVFGQNITRVTNQSQHPYKHRPADMATTNSPADGKCYKYDAASGIGIWDTCATGNVGIGTTNRFAGYVGVSTVGPFQTVEVAGNVGIGSDSPGSKLDVVGKIRSIAGGLQLAGTTAGTFALGTTPDLAVNGVQMMVSFPQYDAGDGIEHPQRWQLNNNPTDYLELQNFSGTSGQFYPYFKSHVGSANGPAIGFNPDAGSAGIGTGLFYINGTRNGGTESSINLFQIANNSSAKVTVDSSGNLGIGDATPVNALSVGSGDLFQVNSSGAIAASTGISNSGEYTQSGTSANTFTGTSTFSNATYSALFTGGNVGVGTTTPQTSLSVMGNVGIGTLTADGGRLIVDGGRVGIGTSLPSKLLDILDTSANTNGIRIGSARPVYELIEHDVALPAGAYRWESSAGILQLLRNSSVITPFASVATDLVVDQSGRIGIGTVGPVSRLQIGSQTVTTANQITLGKFETATEANLPVIQQKSVLGTGNDLALGATSTSGGISLYTGATATGLGTSSNALRVFVNNVGNVGIGTFTPQTAVAITNGNVGIGTWTTVAPLNAHVGHTTTFSASNGATWHDILVGSSSNTLNSAIGLAFEFADSLYNVNAGTGIAAVKEVASSDFGAGLAFVTRPQSAVSQERMRITSTGNVGIGTSTPNAAFVVTNGNVGIGTWNAQGGRLVVIGGNVGVGTYLPEEVVDVQGNMSISGNTTNEYAAASQVTYLSTAQFNTTMSAVYGVNLADGTNGGDLVYNVVTPGAYGETSEDLFFFFEIPEELHGRDVTLRSGKFNYLLTASAFINENELFIYNNADGSKTSIDNDTTNITSGATSHSFSSLPYTISGADDVVAVRLKAGLLAGTPLASGSITIYGFEFVFDTD